MTMTAEQSWIDALKAGDTVYFGDYDSGRLCRVDRVTATQVIIGELRFRRSDGRRVGADTWDRIRLLEATPERIAAIRRAALVMRIRRVSWKDQPDDVLSAVAAALFPIAITPDAPDD